MKVSVVVPVWNPGPNLQRCLDSLLSQSMPSQDYELVLVDDGSTDGTAARLDALALQHVEHVKVLHIPNSGWPGKPRNVGVAAARGEYVQFVDNDDVLAPRALQSLYDLATSSEADVVIGKLSSDFRGVNHTVFRQTVVRRTVADFPLVETLTPHKMFRRAFLEHHGIRYPEGPTHLEDQLYVMRAYVKATSVAVLADQACYFYLRRLGSGRNAGDVAMVPEEYYNALEQVLDVIDADVPAGPLRDRLHRRFYRVELLGRLSGPAMLGYDERYRRDLANRVRRSVLTRFSPDVHAASEAATRIQGHLLREDDLVGLVDLANRYSQVALRASAMGPRWRDGRLIVDIDAALFSGNEPLRCERADEGWALPAALAPRTPLCERLLHDAVAESDVELSVVSRADSASFGSTDGLRVRIDKTGAVRVGGTVTIDPLTVMGGHALTPGLWDMRLRLRFAGWSLGAVLRPPFKGRETTPPAGPALLEDGTVVMPYWTRPDPAFALDVSEWARSLTAALAPTCVLETAGRRALRVNLRFAAPPGADLPPLELFLEPRNGTPAGLVAAIGRLRAQDAGATATIRIPRLAIDGSWQAWFRLAEPGAAPPTALPWQVRVTGGRTVVERAYELG